MKPERPLEDASLPALGAAVRRGISGEVSPDDHDRGRARALAAFARRRRAAPRIGLRLAAAALAAVLVVVAVLAWPRAPLRFTIDGAPAVAGAYVHAPSGGASALRFSDGSVIEVARGGSGRVAELGPRGARVLLESGSASVRVMHLPSARWSIEAGPFVIAVIGTAFDVAWSSDTQTLTVDLHEGAVSVRGPLAPQGLDLHAGQRLVARVADSEIHIGEIRSGTASPTLPLPPPAPPPAALPPPDPPIVGPQTISSARAPRRAPPPVASAETWPERVAAGAFRAVIAEAEARGLEAVLKQAPLSDLVALADAARYAGRTDIARRALLAQRDRFASTAEAHAAAFLLGRLADDAGGSPEAALRWYDRYLAEAPRGAFAAEALGRKMMALRRASDPSAVTVATEYLRLHPSGPHAASAREIVGP
ncbi:Hypothetical protein A7982_10140 [Minicystis rosea]|nr:Hypothetical protein A7982_10140 [Minicystis rosea]